MPRYRILQRHTQGKQESLKESLAAIFHKNFTIVTTINLLVMTAYYLIFVTTPSYAREAYAASLSTAGFCSGAMVLGCLLARFLSSSLISLFGCRKILYAGVLIYALSMGLFFVSNSLPLLILQRALAGVGVGVTGTATGTIVACVVPAEHRGFGVSLFSMSTALALALGPFLGILLASHLPYHKVMVITVLASLGCVALALFLGKISPLSGKSRPLYQLNSYIDPRVVRFALVAFIICLSYGSVQAFITSLAAERHLAGPASVFFLCYAIAVLATRPYTGRLYDCRGEKIVFYPVFLLNALAICLLAHAYNGFLLILSGILLGASFGNFQSIAQAVSLSMVSRSRYAQATTTFFIFFDLGIGIGPYIFGFLVEPMGYAGMYDVLALTVIAAGAVYAFVRGRHIG